MQILLQILNMRLPIYKFCCYNTFCLGILPNSAVYGLQLGVRYRSNMSGAIPTEFVSQHKLRA